MEAQVRVLKPAMENRYKVELPVKHVMVPWIIEYAAFLLNRFAVGHDDKTAYERLQGKRALHHGIEFGESVHWLEGQTCRGCAREDVQHTASWRVPRSAGQGKSGEIVVADENGIWKTRTVQRKPLDERWDPKNIDVIKG